PPPCWYPSLDQTSALFLSPPPSTPSISPLSLHDALPIFPAAAVLALLAAPSAHAGLLFPESGGSPNADSIHTLYVMVFVLGLFIDRKSTRLNSSHDQTSYAVFCLKKKKNTTEKPSGPRQS